ncbi:MAG: MBL fold metallo-hydrolase [Cyanobacteria bacterium J06597_1]
MRFTWYGANSWLIEVSGLRILLDPWLVGPLEFGGLSWLFRASRDRSPTIPEAIDLVLVSQGLEDHSHPETLDTLEKSIPVVGSPKAAKVCRQLGFEQVTPLDFGETYRLHDRVEILAIEGALTGIKPENGYVLKAVETGSKIYYEPHGFYPDSLQEQAPVDVVIGPVSDIAIPLAGAIVRGNTSAIELTKMLQPRYFLRSTAGDDGVVYGGLLSSVLKARGSVEALQAAIDNLRLNTQVLSPSVNEPLQLSMETPTAASTDVT